MSAAQTIFFSGIGGSGMSALAQVLRRQGTRVRGSDRAFDRNQNRELADQLTAQGIELAPQDGTGVDDSIGELVASSAVEETVSDVQRARERGIPVTKRAELLARLFNAADIGIAIAGTSGKSTVTGMIGHILRSAGHSPTIINGGVMLNALTPPDLGNAVCGSSALMVVEADESDGTLPGYRPDIGVVTNITLDHMSMDELMAQFKAFAAVARSAVVINLDCPQSRQLLDLVAHPVTFSLHNGSVDFVATDVVFGRGITSFRVRGTEIRLPQIGEHNVANSLAAIAACQARNVTIADSARALESFRGIRRRLEQVGVGAGVTVIDDFAHNPEKIQATLRAAKSSWERLLVLYQPHGFTPTRLAKDRIIEVFSSLLKADDRLGMPEIFYAGGTVDMRISSRDLIDPIRRAGIQARYFEDREAVMDWLVAEARPGDAIIVMGARDPSLPECAQQALRQLQARS